MTSARENVLNAVKDLIETALPAADVGRNQDKSDNIGPGGRVIIFDGTMEEIEVVLGTSPVTYTYEHTIPLEVGTFESDSRERALDVMLKAIGAAILADTTLGGLVEYLEARPPDNDGADVPGSDTLRWSNALLVATYSTSSSLV